MLALFLLVQGHNAPGGGFIAGLAAAGSIALQLLAFDMEHVERVFPFNFVNVVAVGLMLAAGVGFAPVFLGLPFLTSAFESFTLPVIGPVEVSSAFFFDVGVFLVVVGAMMVVIKGIAGDNGFRQQGEESAQALKEDAELWRL